MVRLVRAYCSHGRRTCRRSKAKGKQADAQRHLVIRCSADEMVTGKPPFSGETVGDTLAAVD